MNLSRRDFILITPHKRLKGVQCGEAGNTQNISRRGKSMLWNETLARRERHVRATMLQKNDNLTVTKLKG